MACTGTAPSVGCWHPVYAAQTPLYHRASHLCRPMTELKPTLGIIRKCFRKADAMSRKSRIVVMCLASSALAAPALAQHVYPVQKQSPEQQNQDDTRCITWAIQQSGFDPAKPGLAPQASALTSTAGSSARVRSGTPDTVARAMTRRDAGDAAVAGAIGAASTQPAASAAAAAILGRDAGNVTVGGAVAGARVRPDANQNTALQQEQAVSQQQLVGQASFQKARTACLEARGYTVQ